MAGYKRGDYLSTQAPDKHMTIDTMTERQLLFDTLLESCADPLRIELDACREVVIAPRALGDYLTSDTLRIFAVNGAGRVPFLWTYAEGVGDARTATWALAPFAILEWQGDDNDDVQLVAIWALDRPADLTPELRRFGAAMGVSLTQLACALPGTLSGGHRWRFALSAPSQRHPLHVATAALAGGVHGAGGPGHV
jgi:hypothetical protein